MSSDIAVSLTSALAALPTDKPFVEVFRRDGEISVELYVPQGVDRQTPHSRDELYIIAEGTGTFRRDQESVTFGPGDLLYVPAWVDHRFETFSPDFKVWVIFYGPKR
ncbi:MAG: cupin [Phenylobacterium zucineum]|nr:MAG: cupin [Phenylobacterium zucineum]